MRAIVIHNDETAVWDVVVHVVENSDRRGVHITVETKDRQVLDKALSASLCHCGFEEALDEFDSIVSKTERDEVALDFLKAHTQGCTEGVVFAALVSGIRLLVGFWQTFKGICNPHRPVCDTQGMEHPPHEDARTTSPYPGLEKVSRDIISNNPANTVLHMSHPGSTHHRLGTSRPVIPKCHIAGAHQAVNRPVLLEFSLRKVEVVQNGTHEHIKISSFHILRGELVVAEHGAGKLRLCYEIPSPQQRLLVVRVEIGGNRYKSVAVSKGAGANFSAMHDLKPAEEHDVDSHIVFAWTAAHGEAKLTAAEVVLANKKRLGILQRGE
mmetsp:Transcript_5932/g.13490  ORF Transcript_5932/g.13490 Transcript_5932/m.13490 type:complete len:325 (-) Transcript_5932:273-1247(-)